ncbi:MAG: biopolymer transport protein ExbB [Cryomorphaceae bacterium]|jgi:biopolymer transport protein ExbB
MLKFIDQGGPFVWVLLVLSFAGMMIVLEKIIFFQRTKIHVGDLMLGLANHVRSGAHDEALREAARAPGSVARVAHATLMRHYLPRTDLRDIAMEAGQMEVPRIERNLRGLYTVALIGPLIGMLGTVNGLIETFVKMSNSSGLSSNLDMAKGIYEALITTGLGLLVAVPAYLFYLYFVGRSKRLVHRIERGAIEIVNIICDERDAPRLEEVEISDAMYDKKPAAKKIATKTSKNSKK